MPRRRLSHPRCLRCLRVSGSEFYLSRFELLAIVIPKVRIDDNDASLNSFNSSIYQGDNEVSLFIDRLVPNQSVSELNGQSRRAVDVVA